MPAEYVPTADQRALVENAAAFGITQADIAEQLGIQEKMSTAETKCAKGRREIVRCLTGCLTNGGGA